MFPSPLILLTALLLPFSTLTLAVPTPAPAQLTLSLLDNVNVLAGCPSMTIRCVKDSKWPSGIVGQLEGKREFVWEAPRCQQAEPKRNTNECNRVFEECEGRCEAYAPIPF